MTLAGLNTLQARISAVAGVLLAALVVIAGAGVAALQSIRRTVADELQVHARTAEVTTQTVAHLGQQAQAAERLLNGPDDEASASFREAGRRAHQASEALLLSADISQSERLRLVRAGDLHRQSEAWYHYAHRLLEQSQLGQAANAVATARTLSTSLIALQRDIAGETASRAMLGISSVERAARERETSIWLALVFSTVAGIAIVVATLRSIQMPLAKLINVAHRYARGDLRSVALTAMPRELLDVAEALTLVGTRQRELVSEVRAQSDRIAAAAADLSAMSEQLAAAGTTISEAITEVSQGARHQSEALARGQSALDRLRIDTKSNAEMASQVADGGSRIHELAHRHGEKVTTAGSALVDLGTVVQRSSHQIEDLDRLSGTIHEFVELIKEVSSETNLLAVNAAIEAARAPVGGEGFAVVADEVRQLADSSGDAANDAAKSIAVVRRQIAEAAATMEAGRTRVEGVETVAQGAAEAMQEIVRLVTEVELAARRGGEAARSNARTADEISELLREVAAEAAAHADSSEGVSSAAEQQGASTQEIAGQAAELNQSANRLRSLVRDLRT